MPLPAGTRFGPYEVLAPIGAGGMGEVYRARDTRLGRDVAIKISKDQFSERFEREARAVAALNHPNICTLYDVGPSYLVMEFIEGEPLKGPLPVTTAIAYAVDMLNALEAAHAKGIVHRDLKPGNILVTGERVKLLDFGLAKLNREAPGEEEETHSLDPTRVGAVLGTPAYMAPEQWEGRTADARTDIYSFGCVFYEMLTAQRAGVDRAPVKPAKLEQVLRKCLARNPAERWQSAAAVREALQDVLANPARKFGAAMAAVILVLALIGFGFWQRTAGKTAHLSGRDQWVQLTNFPDSVSQPALSSDGRMLTFVRGPETFSGPGQIYVKILPDREPVQLTHDQRNKMSPVFSPDGSRVAYTVGGWNTWVVPLVGGEPRLWLTNASGLSWLDKQKVLYSEETHPQVNNYMALFTAEETRAGRRPVYLPPVGGMAHRSYLSPDGKSVLVVEMQVGAWGPCRLVPLDGSSMGRTVGPPGAKCTFAGWSPDGKWMYLSSSVGDSFHTWRQRYPDGKPEQITSGPTEEEGIAMTPDGHSFITSVALKQSVVWVHDDKGERPISLEGYSFDPKITSDGKKLCYRILKGGLTTFDASEMRVVELDTGHNDSLFPGLAITGEPGRAYDISPDGRKAVGGAQDREGKQRLWIAALDRQSPPRQIPGVEGQTPVFGKNGEVFFRSNETGPKHVYGVREDGTGLRKLSGMESGSIQGISPDRQWVLAGVRQDGQYTIMAFPVSGGSPVPVVSAAPSTVQHLGWSPDGKLIFFSETSQPTATHIVGRTYVVPLPKGQTFPTTPFTSQADLARQPGVRVIDAYDTAPGPTSDVYAFSRATVQRNLYRIPIP